MRRLSSMILFFIISIALPGEAYRILGIFPMNGKSHFGMFGRLMRGLAERGHQVDVVSHFPLKEQIPNYNDIINLEGTLPSMVNNMTLEMLEGLKKQGSEPYFVGYMFGVVGCNLMNMPDFVNLIKNPPKNPPYDLVIVEIFGAHCYLAMGQHLNVPVVGVESSTILPWANDFVANPDNTAYIPNLFSSLSGRLNFWQRVLNTVINVKAKWEFYQASVSQDDVMKKHFGPHVPGVREVEKNVSLILVNSHYSINGVRPFTTAVVEVGGLHIDERDAKLPENLQKWLDDSKDGFVYISFGSAMKIESLPGHTLAALYVSMKKLAPIRVLMKIAKPDELPAGLPSNVLTHPWTPQLAVLMHKNARAFMTHGGLMGTQESIYCGVPMIGVPLFADQGQNIDLYKQLHLAVGLDYEKLTVEKLDAAFNTVLHDPSYAISVKRMSIQFRDRPMSAIDTAVYWIEYVIRHGGTNIRSPALDLTWWQISLLDVYAFLLLSIVLAVWLMIVTVNKLKGLFYPTNVTKTTMSKKVE